MKQLVPLVIEEENLSATRVPAEAGDENTQSSQPGTIDKTSNSADSHSVPATKKHRSGSKTNKHPSSNVCPYSLRSRHEDNEKIDTHKRTLGTSLAEGEVM